MKKDMHPTYFPQAKVTCNCGASFTVGATMESIHVEICSECHPFYTGKSHLVDTAGRVDKFKARTERAAAIKATAKKQPKKAATQPKASKEALKELRKTLSA